MDLKKHETQVALMCPVCGNTGFKFEENGSEVLNIECSKCGKNHTKDSLIEENQEVLHNYVNEMMKKALKDIKKNFKI